MESEKFQEIDFNSTKKYIYSLLSETDYRFEDQKIMIVYFFIGALDALDSLDELLNEQQKQDLIQFILNCKIDNGKNGFNSGDILVNKNHIVFVYSAMCLLQILGYDIQKEKQNTLFYLKTLQLENGSFLAYQHTFQHDIRMVYAAVAISYFLNDFSSINIEQTTNFILSCQSSQNYGFGLQPFQESHGGATYCAISSLKLLNKLHLVQNKTKLIQWLVNRQQLVYDDDEEQTNLIENQIGLNGRINKTPDSCYSFWIGSTLKILGYEQFLNSDKIKNFISSCKGLKGGFNKYPNQKIGDPVHTLHSIYGINILGFKTTDNLINFELGIKQKHIRQF